MKPRNQDRYLEQEFMRPDYLNNEPGKNPPGALDRREAERVPLFSHVSYTNDDQAVVSREEGQLLNLSKKGCRIVGPALGVGSRTTVALNLEDGKPPLSLAGATVCWNDGYSFGVKFPAMAVEDRHRLQELVLKFATLKGSSQDHTSFRIA